MNAETLYALGFALIFLGVMIVLTALLLLVYSETKEKETRGGGAIVFIGPIPLVIGTGPNTRWMILFAVILTATTIMMFLIYRKEPKTSRG